MKSMNQALTQRMLLGAACLLLALPAGAQPKIGTINLQKAFDGFWKTKQADGLLKEKAGEFDKQRKDLMDGYQKAHDEYKKLLDAASDQAVSADERDKRKKTAEVKLREIQELETQLGQFDRQARSSLNEQQQRYREKILAEIQEVVVTKAKLAHYNLVLDTASRSFNNTLVVLFSDGENDLTEEVLKQINQGAPAEFLKAAEDKPASPEIKPPGEAKPPKKGSKN